MAKRELKPTTAVMPCPLVMATCADLQGKPNIITLAWVGNICSDPPMAGISIRPSRYSHELVSISGEFVINIPSASQAAVVDHCGVISGRDADKFKETGLTAISARHVSAPLIAECPVNIECKVTQVVHLGAHDLFIGEVVALHADESVLNDRGHIDVAKANPMAYAAHEYWSLKEKVGSYGFTAKA